MRAVAEEFAGKAAVVQVNVDKSPGLARQYGISGVPALLLLRKGKVLDRVAGAQPRNSLSAWVGRHIG